MASLLQKDDAVMLDGTAAAASSDIEAPLAAIPTVSKQPLGDGGLWDALNEAAQHQQDNQGT
jgi:hypothetical protein